MVYYLHSDHLGSTTLATDAASAAVPNSRTWYKPYGEIRAGGSSLPTDRRFTGQIDDAAIGLYFYNARYYDPLLARFLSADTVVPEPGNPQSLSRYSYCLGNPVRYSDPTGHYTSDEIKQYLKDTYGDKWQSYWDAWQADPYWMWILGEAQDGYVLKMIGTGQVVQFTDRDGSFGLSGGLLHEYQGQGIYALYDNSMNLIQDTTWLGWGLEVGTLEALFLSGTSPTGYAGGYFEPIYDYSSGSPHFTGEWLHMQLTWKTDLALTAGDSVPMLFTLAWENLIKPRAAQTVVGQVCPVVSTLLTIWSGATLVNNLTVNTAEVVSTYEYVHWQSPKAYPGNPVPSNVIGWVNPNGLLYPAPLP